MKKYQIPVVEVTLLSSSKDQMQTGGGSPESIEKFPAPFGAPKTQHGL